MTTFSISYNSYPVQECYCNCNVLIEFCVSCVGSSVSIFSYLRLRAVLESGLTCIDCSVAIYNVFIRTKSNSPQSTRRKNILHLNINIIFLNLVYFDLKLEKDIFSFHISGLICCFHPLNTILKLPCTRH